MNEMCPHERSLMQLWGSIGSIGLAIAGGYALHEYDLGGPGSILALLLVLNPLCSIPNLYRKEN